MKKGWCWLALVGFALSAGNIAVTESWAETQILAGQDALKEQDYHQAAIYFKEALAVDTCNMLAQQGLKQALAQEAAIDPTRDQSAVMHLVYAQEAQAMSAQHFSTEELSNVCSETPKPLYKKALLALGQWKHGDNTAALRTATPLPKIYGHPTAWNILGLARYHTGDAVQAKLAFKQALDLNPSFHSARLNLATVLMKGGDFKKAEDEIRYVLSETHEKHPQAILSMVTLKNLEGDRAAAAQWSARVGSL